MIARVAGLAQWLERLTVAQEAVGSIPIFRPISLPHIGTVDRPA